ncbi:MAG: hypothetical protein K2F67_03850, partial [Eubacterium sp.]|nr:hypothetical protein [Eubacterium sp.]
RFIETKYITPIIKDNYQCYERMRADGSLYIVVKVGFVVEALIQPCDYIVTASLIDELNKIADGASETLTNKMIAENSEN